MILNAPMSVTVAAWFVLDVNESEKFDALRELYRYLVFYLAVAILPDPAK